MRLVRTPELVRVRRGLTTHRAVICPGGYGGGKTTTALAAYLLWAATGWTGRLFGLAARSNRQFESTLVEESHRIFGAGRGLTRAGSDHWEQPATRGWPPNRFVRLLGSHRNVADRLKSYNLQGLLVDEYSDFPGEDLIATLWTRVRLPHSAIVMTCNPKDPADWAYLDYLTSASRQRKRILVVPHDMRSNPGLTDQAKHDLWHTYQPGTADHDRHIRGRWVSLGGTVFIGCEVAYQPRPPGQVPDRYWISWDWGLASTSHALLLGQIGGRWWVVDEWRHHAATSTRLTTDQQVREMLTHMVRWPALRQRLQGILADPAGSDLKVVLANARRRWGLAHVPIVGAPKPDVGQAYAVLRLWLRSRKLRIDPVGGAHLIGELGRLSWDEVYAARGQDRPLKGEDHGIDAAAYWVWRQAAAGGTSTLSVTTAARRRRRAPAYDDPRYDLLGR